MVHLAGGPGIDVTAEPLTWHRIDNRPDARSLQAFTCTTDRPKSPAGRRLPHPKPWEWEVQAHLREASRRIMPGDLVLVGTGSDGSTLAAAHLVLSPADDYVETLVAAGAVHVDVRGSGGAVADAMMAQCCDIAVAASRAQGSAVALLTGRIHVRNTASQRLAARAGLSPVDAPVGPYQTWARALFLEQVSR